MNYKIKASHLFEKEFKRLCKKHKSAKDDLIAFIQDLKEDPFQGTAIGKDCYKIRIAIKSKGKGKSGGLRLITRVRIVQATIYLLSLYDKSERNSISEKEIDDILKSL